MKTPLTLYLADDHQIVIDGLKLLIGNEDSLQITGYANDGLKAREEIIIKKPDIALVDFSMPGMTGLELIFSLRKVVPTRFIILSMYDNPRQIRDAISAEAAGYILKNAGKAELLQCLRTVMDGGTFFPDRRKLKPEAGMSLFTPRETEIMKLILEGHTTSAIAEDLCLSRLTVETHRKNICRKTETNNALALAKFLQDNNITL